MIIENKSDGNSLAILARRPEGLIISKKENSIDI